jgi:hypothetical protein
MQMGPARLARSPYSPIYGKELSREPQFKIPIVVKKLSLPIMIGSMSQAFKMAIPC